MTGFTGWFTAADPDPRYSRLDNLDGLTDEPYQAAASLATPVRGPIPRRPTRLRRARYFLAGINEHQDRWPASGSNVLELRAAYWAGFRFGWRLPRPIGRLFKAAS